MIFILINNNIIIILINNNIIYIFENNNILFPISFILFNHIMIIGNSYYYIFFLFVSLFIQNFIIVLKFVSPVLNLIILYPFFKLLMIFFSFTIMNK